MRQRDQNWYSLQAARKYPLDDAATSRTDDGQELPTDILVDCQLRWPESLGRFAFIGGVTVTPKLVSVVLLAADTDNSAAVFQPIGAVTVKQPVKRHVHYAISPQQPGVAGFLVFGDTQEPFTGRFSQVSQTRLCSRTGQPYAALPVRSLSKLGRADVLRGHVSVLPGTDLESEVATLSIDGQDRQAIVFRLIQPTVTRNTLSQYIGPCQLRPESRNCGGDAIESLNGVTPDCDGNLTIRLVGFTGEDYCGELAHGISAEDSEGIADVCPDGGIARIVNRFRGEDQCHPEIHSSEYIPWPDTPDSSSSSARIDSSSATPPGPVDSWPWLTLSQLLTFGNESSDPASFQANPLTTRSGHVTRALLPTGATLQLDAVGETNVAVLQARGLGDALDKTISGLTRLPAATRSNAGLVLNYRRVTSNLNPHYEYHVAVLDATAGVLAIWRYNGLHFIEEGSALLPAPVNPSRYYLLTATVTTVSDAVVNILCRAVEFRDGSPVVGWANVTLSINTVKYGTPDGLFGILSDRGSGEFTLFGIDNAS